MPALNHIIIPAKNKDSSAAFLADILGVEAGPQWGPFRTAARRHRVVSP